MGFNSAFKGLKGKFGAKTGHESPDGSIYIYIYTFTLALDGGEWSRPKPSRLTPGKEKLYALQKGPGGGQG